MSILGAVAIVQKDEQCFLVSYHGNQMYHLKWGSLYFSALFSGIFSHAEFCCDEICACIHGVAVKHYKFLFQGFMQQTADLKKGSLEGSQAQSVDIRQEAPTTHKCHRWHQFLPNRPCYLQILSSLMHYSRVFNAYFFRYEL